MRIASFQENWKKNEKSETAMKRDNKKKRWVKPLNTDNTPDANTEAKLSKYNE
jgi:hypothetical protein